jgi:hypothetical protein
MEEQISPSEPDDDDDSEQGNYGPENVRYCVLRNKAPSDVGARVDQNSGQDATARSVANPNIEYA